MPVNLDKPHNWKADITKSVDMYNQWFMDFAPKAFRDTRIEATKDVEATLKSTENLTNIKPEVMRKLPEIFPRVRSRKTPGAMSPNSSASTAASSAPTRNATILPTFPKTAARTDGKSCSKY